MGHVGGGWVMGGRAWAVCLVQHVGLCPPAGSPSGPVGKAQGLAQEHRQDPLVQPWVLGGEMDRNLKQMELRSGGGTGRWGCHAPAPPNSCPGHAEHQAAALGESTLVILRFFHYCINGVDKTNSEIDSFENILFVLKCGN